MAKNENRHPYRTVEQYNDFALPAWAYRGNKSQPVAAPHPECTTGTWYVNIGEANNFDAEFKVNYPNSAQMFELNVVGGDTAFGWHSYQHVELVTSIEAVEKFTDSVIAYRDSVRRGFDNFRYNCNFHPEYKISDPLLLPSAIGVYRREDLK